MSLAVFTVYVLVNPDHYLSPQVAFVSLNLMNILDWSTQFLPILLAFGAQVFKFFLSHKYVHRESAGPLIAKNTNEFRTRTKQLLCSRRKGEINSWVMLYQ